MTEELAQRLLDRFGPGGLRRASGAELASTVVPGPVAGLLTEVGVPAQVGPYFAGEPGDPFVLGDYCARLGLTAPKGTEGWVRLGTDRGSELCVDPAGRVWSVFVTFDLPAVPVSGTLEALLLGLAELDLTLGKLAAADRPKEIFELFASVESRLRAIDLRAFENDENWWPRVLEDVRHTRGVPAYAAFKYRDGDGEAQIATANGALALHPEEVVWSGLADSGVSAEDVLEVYTELAACFMPGHYCSVWMARTFPGANFSHSYDYGDTAAEREAGIRELASALEEGSK